MFAAHFMKVFGKGSDVAEDGPVVGFEALQGLNDEPSNDGPEDADEDDEEAHGDEHEPDAEVWEVAGWQAW